MLAIIIPYYKHTFFEATLQSLANQSDKRFKVYIGDDGSPENPGFLIEKYKGQFDFVYHRFETNLGGSSLVKQWERCIALSLDEPWILILGDDDVFGENVVEAFYENLEESKLVSNVIRFATIKIDEKGAKTSAVYLHPKIEKTTDFLFRNTRSSLSEYVFKKEKVNNIEFKKFPLAWYSDVLAVMEFSDFKNIFSINEAQVYVRVTNLSISGKKDNFYLKAVAKFEFYYYLLYYKINFFSEDQILELTKKINNCYLNKKIRVDWFFKISVIYIKNLKFSYYFKFINSILRSLIKKL